MTPASRMSSTERRDAVLQVAAAAFAEGGYEGTSTEEIARRAEISQPYIFRLFGTKKDLFIAVVEACFGRTVAAFEAAAEGLTGQEALGAMGLAYMELIKDPVNLMVEMHAFTAAANQPEIRRAAREGMRQVWETAAVRSGLGQDEIREWVAYGMLCNVVAALGLDQATEAWACQLMPAHADGSPKFSRTA